MSKIGDVFRAIGNRIDRPKDVKISSEKATVEAGEQFIKSEEVPSASNFITELKEGVIDPIKGLIKEHPDLTTFITAMAAGGVAGLLAKKAEGKNQITDYLTDLKTVANKAARREKVENILVKSGFISAFVSIGTAIGFAMASMEIPAFMALGGTGASIVGCILAERDKTTLSEDKKFMIPSGNSFITIPPAGDKVMFCEILKDTDGQKISPYRVIDLPAGRKATHFSLNKDKYNFYVNYEDSSVMTKVSFDGKEQKDINLLKDKQVQ